MFDALQRKAVDEVEALTADLPAELRGMLRALAELCGGRDALEQGRARLAAAPADVQVALNELIEIADSLAGRFPGLPLYFDLGELRGYHYHTGVVFAAFVPGVGQSIAQGGRYDDIGATGSVSSRLCPGRMRLLRARQAATGSWRCAMAIGRWRRWRPEIPPAAAGIELPRWGQVLWVRMS